MPCRIMRSWSAWKTRAERPFDLQVVADVDVLVEDEMCLSREMPPNSAEMQAGFAEAALPDRDAHGVRAARRVPRIDRDRIAPRGLQDRIASASVRIALMFWLSVWSSTNAEPCCKV